jgi:anti-sigma regulatory factor (Ser/Thr protein kinase)
MGSMLTIELSADPATVRLVRKLVGTAARIEGASELEAHLIEVAVGEGLAHGTESENGEPGSVTVGVDLRGGRFIVSIARQRSAPGLIDMPADSRDDYAIGWGLYIIAQVMDEVEIRQPVKRGQTLELRLVKRIG